MSILITIRRSYAGVTLEPPSSQPRCAMRASGAGRASSQHVEPCAQSRPKPKREGLPLFYIFPAPSATVSIHTTRTQIGLCVSKGAALPSRRTRGEGEAEAVTQTECPPHRPRPLQLRALWPAASAAASHLAIRLTRPPQGWPSAAPRPTSALPRSYCGRWYPNSPGPILGQAIVTRDSQSASLPLLAVAGLAGRGHRVAGGWFPKVTLRQG